MYVICPPPLLKIYVVPAGRQRRKYTFSYINIVPQNSIIPLNCTMRNYKEPFKIVPELRTICAAHAGRKNENLIGAYGKC